MNVFKKGKCNIMQTKYYDIAYFNDRIYSITEYSSSSNVQENIINNKYNICNVRVAFKENATDKDYKIKNIALSEYKLHQNVFFSMYANTFENALKTFRKFLKESN